MGAAPVKTLGGDEVVLDTFETAREVEVDVVVTAGAEELAGAEVIGAEVCGTETERVTPADAHRARAALRAARIGLDIWS